MKGRQWIFLSVLALALIGWSGCAQRNGEMAETEEPAPRVQRPVEQAEQAATEVRTEIADFRDRMGRNLEDYEASLKDLEGRIEKRQGQAREQLQKEIDALRQEKQQFQDRLDKLADGTRESWQQARQDLDKEWERLQKRLEDLRTKIGQ